MEMVVQVHYTDQCMQNLTWLAARYNRVASLRIVLQRFFSRLRARSCQLATAIYQSKMLVSVKIVSGCKLLKPWGVHQVSEIVTLGDIYCHVVASKVKSGSSFCMPPELQDQQFVLLDREKPK